MVAAISFRLEKGLQSAVVCHLGWDNRQTALLQASKAQFESLAEPLTERDMKAHVPHVLRSTHLS